MYSFLVSPQRLYGCFSLPLCVSASATKSRSMIPGLEAKPVLRDHRAHGLNPVVFEPEHDQIHGADGLTVWERTLRRS